MNLQPVWASPTSIHPSSEAGKDEGLQILWADSGLQILWAAEGVGQLGSIT